MTDQTSDDTASNEPAGTPRTRESLAGSGERRAFGIEDASAMPRSGEAPFQRPAVSTSALQAAELARLSLGAAGLALSLLMLWLMFGPTSSPWFNPAAATSTTSAALKPLGRPGLAQAGVEACGTPVAIASSPSDGRLPLKADVTGLMEADIESFAIIGKEAVAAGRLQDAESAFLMSCRVAQQISGADSLQSARAKAQLGWLYAQLAIAGGAGTEAAREVMIARATQLYTESLRLFVAQPEQAGKKPRLVVEASLPFPQTATETKPPGVAIPVGPTQATPRAASLALLPQSHGTPSPARARSQAAQDQHDAAAALATPYPAIKLNADLRCNSRTAGVKPIERRGRAEGKVISAKAAANVAELYRGR